MPGIRRRTGALRAGVLLLGLFGTDTVSAQNALPPTATPVPWAVGDTLTYEVRVGRARAGEAQLRVEGIDTVRGFPTYHFTLSMRAGWGLLSIAYEYASWYDVHDLVSRRFTREIDEPFYEGTRHFAIHPEEERWERTDADQSGSAPRLPIDELAFFFFARTLDLQVGAEHVLNRYFKTEDNPVRIRVLRRERATVPAGTFDVVVIQPVVGSGGLLGPDQDAEIFFTDDEDGHLAYFRAKVPIVGSMSLHLASVTRGAAAELGGDSGE